MTEAMTREELLALPAVIDVPTAARVLGMGHNAVYDMIKADRFPSTVLRLGRLVKIPTEPLLVAIGVVRDP